LEAHSEWLPEALQIVHGLLRGRTIDFQGQYCQVRDLALRPRGPRPEGSPIPIGARADRPRSLRLTAQYADIWNTTEARAAEHLGPIQQAVDNACAKVGRNPATLARTAHVLIDLPGSEHSQIPPWARAYRASRGLAGGTPEELAEGLKAFARAGISHVQLWLEPDTMAGIDAFQPVLELLDRA